MTITDEERAKMLEEQHEWYSKMIAVKFEIVKECRQRTIDMLNSKESLTKFGIRYFYAGKIDYLTSHLEAMGVSNGKRLINLYRSNALLLPNSVPVFSYDLTVRRTTKGYPEFDSNYLSFAQGFDLIFDLDSPKGDVMDSYLKAKELKAILDEYKVPYYCKNSGRRGFHFIIPAEYMPKMEIVSLINTINHVLVHFRAIHNMEEYIDSTVTNPKGLIKISYSYDSGNISLPLNDWEFNNFKPEMVTMRYVLKNINIKNRGLFVRVHNLSEEELRKNVIKFIDEYK